MSSPVVIVNPNSAGGQTRRRWQRLEAGIRDGLGDFQTIFTERPGHATELCRSALRQGADLVIAMGGDGTLNEVVNGFFEDGKQVSPMARIGLLPAGTGGDFPRTTGASRALEDAARGIANATARTIDVGRLSYIATDGTPASRYFINIASFGIAGLVDRYVNRSSKMLGGKASFMASTLRASLAYKNARVRVSLDDGPVSERTINNLAVANGRFFGGGMMIAPDAALDDGIFDVVTIGDAGVLDMALHLGKIYRGRHLALPFITVERARRVRAESATGEEVLLDVDGEQPGRLPATFEIVPAAVRLAG